jgi:hypothetical protein
MSFSMSFHLTLLGRQERTGWTTPDATCKNSTRQHAVDGCPLIGK